MARFLTFNAIVILSCSVCSHFGFELAGQLFAPAVVVFLFGIGITVIKSEVIFFGGFGPFIAATARMICMLLWLYTITYYLAVERGEGDRPIFPGRHVHAYNRSYPLVEGTIGRVIEASAYVVQRDVLDIPPHHVGRFDVIDKFFWPANFFDKCLRPAYWRYEEVRPANWAHPN